MKDVVLLKNKDDINVVVEVLEKYESLLYDNTDISGVKNKDSLGDIICIKKK